jgi:hypothetical protein
MKTFKQFHADQILLETIMRKSAVSAYALKGKKQGDSSVSHYLEAKRLLTSSRVDKDMNRKVEIIVRALIKISDGLISNRWQLGSVSAQITSLATL